MSCYPAIDAKGLGIGYCNPAAFNRIFLKAGSNSYETAWCDITYFCCTYLSTTGEEYPQSLPVCAMYDYILGGIERVTRSGLWTGEGGGMYSMGFQTLCCSGKDIEYPCTVLVGDCM